LELRQEIIEIERSSAHFPLHSGGFFFINCFHRFFDQTNDVTHAKNSACKSIRNKEFKLIEFFPGSRELDWLPRHFAHRQCGAASRIAVELCQNDSCNR